MNQIISVLFSEHDLHLPALMEPDYLPEDTASTIVLSSSDSVPSHSSYTSALGGLFPTSVFRSQFLFHLSTRLPLKLMHQIVPPVGTPVAVIYKHLCCFPHFLNVLGSISMTLSSAHSCLNSWWYKCLCRWSFCCSGLSSSWISLLSTSYFCHTDNYLLSF